MHVSIFYQKAEMGLYNDGAIRRKPEEALFASVGLSPYSRSRLPIVAGLGSLIPSLTVCTYLHTLKLGVLLLVHEG